MKKRRCPALLIGASASNQGKTTVTAALAYHHRKRGGRVRVFKVGPDFLDPMILEYASGNPVQQLDLWMVGEDECRRLLYDAAGEADLILIEGVMGFYDGTPSTADLAEKFGIPTVIVINAGSMAQTFNAIAHGLTTYRDGITFAGVLANGIASPRHLDMLSEGSSPAVPFLGGLMRDQSISLPERHLGLVQAQEVNDLAGRIDAAATALSRTELVNLMPEIEFCEAGSCKSAAPLEGIRVAVARDACFSFLYAANLQLLNDLGARLQFFSPLVDDKLPEADSIYLPGGYPELHLDRLQENTGMKQALKAHFDAGKPIYAECGGMLYLLDSLTDKQGKEAKMVGLLPGKAVMQNRLARLGYQQAEFPKGALRGHTFHHSLVQAEISPACRARHPHNAIEGEAIYHLKRMWASYVHLYFPSNPVAVADLFLQS